MRFQAVLTITKTGLFGFGSSVPPTADDANKAASDFAKKNGVTVERVAFDKDTQQAAVIVEGTPNSTDTSPAFDSFKANIIQASTGVQKAAVPFVIGFGIIAGIVIVGFFSIKWTVESVTELTGAVDDFVNSPVVKIATIGAIGFIGLEIVRRFIR